jgi:RNA polymerase sigma-70 factor (ECF subfamily)
MANQTARSETVFGDSAGQQARDRRLVPLDFAEIVRVHRRTLEGRALWLTRSESDAADLLQETLLRALRGRRRALEPDMVLRWLYTIMYNAFLDNWRASATRRWVSLDSFREERIASEERAPPPPWSLIDDERLHGCIRALPPKARMMVQLSLDGVSYAELARRLGVPTATVGTRLFRARKRLRTLLSDAVGLEPSNLGERKASQSVVRAAPIERDRARKRTTS